MTTAPKSRTPTRQVSHLGEVRFDGTVWSTPSTAARAICMPMRREVRRQIEGDVRAWAQRAQVSEDAPPTEVEA